MTGRVAVVTVMLVGLPAALVGAAVTASNRWGAPDTTACQDVIDGGSVVVGMCVAPESPAWALTAGAAVPALLVALVAWLWRRGRSGRQVWSA